MFTSLMIFQIREYLKYSVLNLMRRCMGLYARYIIIGQILKMLQTRYNYLISYINLILLTLSR